MRYNIFLLILFIAFAGCKKENDITGPVTNSPLSDVKVKDGVIYTLEVSKDKLGIFDTLNVTLTALNIRFNTAYVSASANNWSLTNDSGRTINDGFLGFNFDTVKLMPNKPEILNHLSYQLIYIFNAPINPGKYLFHLNLNNGLSFEINLSLSKSENEITDTTGIISPIFPLKVGNKWTYSKKTLFKDGTVTDAGTFSWTIIGEALIDGEKWFWLSYSGGGGYFITSDFLSSVGPVKTIVNPDRYGDPGYYWELISTNVK
jgi:hypothetical protein